MRLIVIYLSTAAAIAAQPAFAADALKFGSPPSWVVSRTIPDAKPTNAPFQELLADEQIAFDHGKMSAYSESAFKIQNPQGLSAGNISLNWQPATDSLTVHKLVILRGGKTIDVLASGQKFTTLRRETNLEAATLDGTLTANIQPEGLQEGDIVVLATSLERYDPTLQGHAEVTFADWNGQPIASGYASISWPSDEKLDVRTTNTLPAIRRNSNAHGSDVEISGTDIQPLILPSDAPLRFRVGRFGEATDFKSWNGVASLMLPLFRDAATLPASGPLHDEVERIRAATNDPKKRAELALALVQDRVRYVALLMGQGGYVPASAEVTWSRRYGDCKAKTALLLAILKPLGIDAVPVLVNTELGDAIADRLPALGMFNHVLVRVHVNGKEYWLDGTRTGDSDLDRIEVPNFGWVLPLVANATLAHLVPAARTTPDLETRTEIDASNGVYAGAKASVVSIISHDYAVALNNVLGALTPSQQQEFFDRYWRKQLDLITPGPSSFSFDKQKGELRVSMTGEAKLDWSDGFFHVPNSSIGYKADFDRQAGPAHDAPVEVSYPTFEKSVTEVHLPRGYFAGHTIGSGSPVNETLAGIEYRRIRSGADDTIKVEISSRALVPEVPYKQAIADAPRLRTLADEDVSLRVPETYKLTAADVEATQKEEISSTRDLITRGNLLVNSHKPELAIPLFTKAIANDPKNTDALADRAFANLYTNNSAAAEKDLDAAETIDPNNPVILRARGLLSESKGECAKAVDFFTRSLLKQPENPFAIGHRANCEAALSKYDQALADAEIALKADPSWSALRVMRANILIRQGKRELAAKEAEVLVRENPNSNYAWVAAGKTYAALGDHEKALEAINHALSIKPEAFVYVNREQVRTRTEIIARMGDLDAALKLDPNSEDALALKAQLLSEGGDYKNALLYLDRIKADSSDRYAQRQRAIVLYKAGRVADAEKLFGAERLAAKSADELNSLCWSKATAGVMLDSALQDCRDALKLNPNSAMYLDSLGMVFLKLGKLDEALDAYNQAIARNSGANSLMGRSFVYSRKGDRVHAEADAAAARKLYNDIDSSFADYGLKSGQAQTSKAPASRP